MNTKLPIKFLENMKNLLAEDYQNYLDSFDGKRVYGLRVNTSKISVEDFLKITPFKLESIPWCKTGFYYSGEDRPSKHPYYYAGLYYLQEPSAMIPAEVLPVDENCMVLDGCSAPGGKSTQLACRMNGKGILLSNDISASRSQATLKNVTLAGVKNTVITSEDLNKLADNYPETFDRILIDAPCSGEGMFRKDSGLISSWKDNSNEYYASLQKNIVTSALKMLKDGGYLVYSTCTFSPVEDEEVVQFMLDSDPSLKLVPITKYEGFEDGVNGLTECKRLYPHKLKGEGHFVALLHKGENESSTFIEEAVEVQFPDDFFKNVNLSLTNIKRINDKFLMTTSLPTNRIRVIRDGILLGEMSKKGFEPSVQFALSLMKEEFKQVIDLQQSDSRVLKYLKGETIDVSEFNFNGWVLVCVDGYPLGFGKVAGNVFKNKYDKSYRYI